MNDDPTARLDGSGPKRPGGQSQSFGPNVKLGLADPHQFNPGVACNPNRTPARSQPKPTSASRPPTDVWWAAEPCSRCRYVASTQT